jgi:hypothetical protein
MTILRNWIGNQIILAATFVAVGILASFGPPLRASCYDQNLGICQTTCDTTSQDCGSNNAICQVEYCGTHNSPYCSVAGTSQGCTHWPCAAGSQSSNCPCAPC